MLPKRVRDALELRDAYRQVFRSEAGRKVLGDLVKRYFVNSPIMGDEKTTLINVGMQESIRFLLKRSLGSDRDFENAIRDAQATNNQEPE